MEELPKWLDNRYWILFDAFGRETFKHEDAVRVLVEKNQDKPREAPVFIAKLREAGYLATEISQKDKGQKLYRLVSRTDMIKEVLNLKDGTLNRKDIDTLLKKAADLIRTRVDYKFILILLFMKRISDKWQQEYEQAYKDALEDGFSEKEAETEAKSQAYHDFNLPDEYTWENMRKDVERLPENFSKALKAVAEKNPELKDVVDSVDFIQFTSSTENAEILRQLVELFSERRLRNVSTDILGDSYEWIIRYFAPTKAKEGEIYTPREVVKLLIEVLDPKPEESVYDPACGSAGMLIESYLHVKAKHGVKGVQKLFLYGQEVNQKTIALAKMNCYIHDIRDSNLMFGDTFLYPKFKEGDSLRKFDVVIANPPWNQDGYGEDKLKKAEFWKQRFEFGVVPQQSADWAWIQHMLYSANDKNGRVGIVIDNGALFRGGKEGAIRSKILERDLIECVILLPEKLFYNTGAPGAILILNKNKAKERKDKILFINASEQFEQHPEIRKLNRLSESNIEAIAKRYKSFGEDDGFAKAVSLSKVRENDYNLNVPLYVAPENEEEAIDIASEFSQLEAIEAERKKYLDHIRNYVSELTHIKK